MNKQLGIKTTTYIGPLQIPLESEQLFKSNNKNVCLDCGVLITLENDSGWEAFTEESGVMQSVCVACDLVRDNITEKALPIDELDAIV